PDIPSLTSSCNTSYITHIHTLSLHDALPIYPGKPRMTRDEQKQLGLQVAAEVYKQMPVQPDSSPETQYIQALGKRLVNTIPADRDRKSTRLNSSHEWISYAVFCLKKKKTTI